MRLIQSLIGVFILFLCSCQLFESASPELVIKVEADIELNLREQLPTDGNGFYLNLTSSDTTDCAGLEYHCDYSLQGSTLLFHVFGIKDSDHCDGNSYHVMSDVLLHPSNGSYDVRFVVGDDIENFGKLMINNERVNLTFPELIGLRIPYETLYRIPRGTVWGYVAGEGDLDGALAWLEDKFLLYGRIPNLRPGYYGYFTISDELSERRIYPQPDFQNYHPFVFHLEEEESGLEELRESFSGTFDESVKLEMMTWTGRKL